MATKIAKEAKETKKPIKAEKAESIEETEELEVREMTPTRNPLQGNYVFIGKKGAMAYVLAVVTQFSAGAKEVIIKARGKSISRAVDVAEIITHQSPEVTKKSISTSTEEVVTMDGRPLKVSSIEIILKK